LKFLKGVVFGSTSELVSFLSIFDHIAVSISVENFQLEIHTELEDNGLVGSPAVSWPASIAVGLKIGWRIR
jgi:hypothetical protein